MRKKWLYGFGLTLVCLLFSVLLQAKNRWTLEFQPGVAEIASSRLVIHQDGYDDIDFMAEYTSEPFKSPIYYSLRAGYCFNESTAIELEMNHLKIFLENKPEEIQQFSISHGYNQLWMNIAKHYFGFCARFGIGTVIAHPENTVRGKELPENSGFAWGYQMSGFTSQVALQKRFFLSNRLFISLEAKYNMSSVKVDVVNGYGKVPVFAFHGLFGLGIKI